MRDILQIGAAMTRKKKNTRKPDVASLTIRIPETLLTDLDTWRENQSVPPSRTATVVAAIEAFIAGDN